MDGSPPKEPQFFVSDSFETYGPFTRSQIRQRMCEKEISMAAMFWAEGMRTWLPLTRLSDYPQAALQVPLKTTAPKNKYEKTKVIALWSVSILTVLAIGAYAILAV